MPAPTQDSIDAMARVCLAQVNGSLIPIGFSMGGIVALAMARLAPQRIGAMGLVDTNASADSFARAALRPRQQHDVCAGELERVVIEELKPNYLAAANRSDEDLLSLLRDMALALGPRIFVAQSEALRTRLDQRHVLPKLNVPTFVACGEEDELCPPALHHKMAAAARDAELHVVSGAGHMLPLEQPAILARLLSIWLQRTGGMQVG